MRQTFDLVFLIFFKAEFESVYLKNLESGLVLRYGKFMCVL